MNQGRVYSYRTYLLSYGFQGKQWSMQVIAASETEAMQRIQACAAFGKVDGELMAEIPAVVGGGLLTRLICWWRNR